MFQVSGLARIIKISLLVLALLFTSFYCKKPGSVDTGKPNVILITIDTLRADYLSCYKEGFAKTPNLDMLAKDGILFERCITQVPLTLPSHVSILSGTYPAYNSVRDNGGSVPQDLELVSEKLQKQGYTTAAFIAADVLHSKWGINQGFNTYSDKFQKSQSKETIIGELEKPAQEIIANAITWIKANQKKSIFVWIHLFDPHSPYQPPTPFDNKYPDNRYRGEVEYTDHHLGIFFNFLKKIGLYRQSIIIALSDHGQGLGEHNEPTHGIFVYDTTAWVPLIIKPRKDSIKKKVGNLVELVDIAPTILDLLEIPIPDAIQGTSLLPLMEGNQATGENIAITETYYPRYHYGWSELKAIYSKNWKYILAPKEELYNIKEDSKESTNLTAEKKSLAKQLRTKLLYYLKKTSKNSIKPVKKKKISQKDLKNLKSLGYITSRVKPSKTGNMPDPKDKIQIANKLTSAELLIKKGEFDVALALLRVVLKSDPHLIDVHINLGVVLSKKKLYKEAKEQFEKALELDPPDEYEGLNTQKAKVYYNLGLTALRLNEAEKAINYFENSKKNDPNVKNANLNMGYIYSLRKEDKKAIQYLKEEIRVNPESAIAHFLLANSFFYTSNYSEAEGHYKQAIKLQPDYPQAFDNLGNTLEQLGKNQEALKNYKMVIKLQPQFPEGHFILGNLLVKMENKKEALDYYQTALKLAKKSRNNKLISEIENAIKNL